MRARVALFSRSKPVQPITGFPQMEKSQMSGKVVVAREET
jgi:hypothetical protein